LTKKGQSEILQDQIYQEVRESQKVENRCCKGNYWI